MKKTIGRGKTNNELYFLDVDGNIHSAFSSLSHNKMDIWHSRPGHPSRLCFQLLVQNVPVIHANKNAFCDVCLLDHGSYLQVAQRIWQVSKRSLSEIIQVLRGANTGGMRIRVGGEGERYAPSPVPLTPRYGTGMMYIFT